MIGRQDNENLYLIYSDDLYTWDDGRAILKPEYPWEFVQIGNCGSPIELDEGWLLFTHGVAGGSSKRTGSACCFATTSLHIRGPPAPTNAKIELAAAHPNDRAGYTNGKTAFIQRITAQAKTAHKAAETVGAGRSAVAAHAASRRRFSHVRRR